MRYLPLLLIAVPFLVPLHIAPVSSFYAEWSAAALVLLLVGVEALNGKHTRWQPPRSAQIAVLLICAGVLFHTVFGQDVAPGAALNYAIFAVVFLIAMVSGGTLVLNNSVCAVMERLSSGFAVVALLSIVPATLQMHDAQAWPWLVFDSSAFVSNVAQRNHFGALLWIGVAAVAHLYQTHKVSARIALPAVIILLVSSSISGSRSSFLYLGVVATILVYTRPSSIGAKRAWWIAGGLVAMYLMIDALLQQFGIASSGGRVFDAANSNEVRLHHFWTAAKAFVSAPLVGHGPGSFFWLSVERMGEFPVGIQPTVGENAHNLFLQLLADFGAVGVVISAIAVSLVWRALIHAKNKGNLFGLSLLGIICAYSMVEYPLWYLYFLIPFGLVLGACLADAGSGRTVRTGGAWGSRIRTVGIAAVCVVTLTTTLNEYRYLSDVYRRLGLVQQFGGAAVLGDADVNALRHVQPRGIFSAYVQPLLWLPNLSGLPDLDGVLPCDVSLRAFPTPGMFSACMNTRSREGDSDEVRRLARAACDAYPSIAPWMLAQVAEKGEIASTQNDLVCGPRRY